MVGVGTALVLRTRREIMVGVAEAVKRASRRDDIDGEARLVMRWVGRCEVVTGALEPPVEVMRTTLRDDMPTPDAAVMRATLREAMAGALTVTIVTGCRMRAVGAGGPVQRDSRSRSNSDRQLRPHQAARGAVGNWRSRSH